MTQSRTLSVTAMLAATALFVAPTTAHADPAAPQPGTACSENLAGALTQLPDGQSFLECDNSPGSYQWSPFTGAYPSSDRWLTYGPALRLHGQGVRNPEILSGNWTGYPQDAAATCSADQTTVVSAGQVGPAQISTGEPGQPLKFEVLPVVFSIMLMGNCLWESAS